MTWLFNRISKCMALVATAVIALVLVAGCGSNQGSSRAASSSASTSAISSSVSTASSSASESSGSSSATTASGSASSGEDIIVIETVDYTKDFVKGGDSTMSMYKTKDGVVVYDLDIDKKAVTSSQSATYAENGDAGLAYILENGYPNKTYTNNKGMDAYITQMAIWWYMNEDALSSDFKNATADKDEYGLVEKTRTLVEEARGATPAAKSGTAKIYVTDNPETSRVIGLFE